MHTNIKRTCCNFLNLGSWVTHLLKHTPDNLSEPAYGCHQRVWRRDCRGCVVRRRLRLRE